MNAITEWLEGSDRYLHHHGPCVPWMRELPDKCVDHVITDPPYDAHTHSKSRSGRNLPDSVEFSCRARRAVDFGFEPIDAAIIDELAREYARLTKRWVLVFSNVELSHVWRDALTAHGLDYVRTMAWVKQRATPQFTGDRPGQGFEAITVAHPKGKKRWNAGGKLGVYTHPVVANCNGHRADRFHTTQKPLSLLLELTGDFTDPGDVILDSHAGSCTHGIAALRLGRRYLGAEIQEEYAAKGRAWLQAECDQNDIAALKGQIGLFAGGQK
jgi:DNA modification methylase